MRSTETSRQDVHKTMYEQLRLEPAMRGHSVTFYQLIQRTSTERANVGAVSTSTALPLAGATPAHTQSEHEADETEEDSQPAPADQDNTLPPMNPHPPPAGYVQPPLSPPTESAIATMLAEATAMRAEATAMLGDIDPAATESARIAGNETQQSEATAMDEDSEPVRIAGNGSRQPAASGVSTDSGPVTIAADGSGHPPDEPADASEQSTDTTMATDLEPTADVARGSQACPSAVPATSASDLMCHEPMVSAAASPSDTAWQADHPFRACTALQQTDTRLGLIFPWVKTAAEASELWHALEALAELHVSSNNDAAWTPLHHHRGGAR